MGTPFEAGPRPGAGDRHPKTRKKYYGLKATPCAINDLRFAGERWHAGSADLPKESSMKLHWSPRSPFVRKVMVALHETGLVDRVHTVRTVVAVTQPNAVLQRDNPLSKIPTLVLDDGSALFDSRVI